MNKEPIYVIEVLCCKAEEVEKNINNLLYLAYSLPSRDIGFYHEKEVAVEDLNNNNLNIREFTYDYAILLKRSPGLYNVTLEEDILLFKWNKEKQGFFEVKYEISN